MTKKEFCKKYNITEDQFIGKKEIPGDLYLQSVTGLPDGFAPTVGGSLDLRSVTSLPDGFAPTVGGDLYLRSVTGLPDGFAPTVGGFLDLRSVTSLPDGFAPTVGGSLDLQSVTSLPDGFAPTRINQSILKSEIKSKINNIELSWQNGRFFFIDGIMTEIISTRGRVSTVKIVGKNDLSFLVTDGKGKYAHGKSIKEAKEDLMFKISDRNKSDYSHLKLDSMMTFEKAIECYRVITGACSQGTKHFVNTFLKNRKQNYSIQEIITLTENQYGSSTFRNFFQK